ncbi:MAG: hypothetical protein ACTS8A_03845 [Arsenophonus sp. ET-LJ4-MAG3]
MWKKGVLLKVIKGLTLTVTIINCYKHKNGWNLQKIEVICNYKK